MVVVKMDPFIGEIRLFAGNFAPAGWLLCNGQSVPVSQYPNLYSVIGDLYGGDDQFFNVPDFRGRAPLQQGQGSGLTERVLAKPGGETAVALTLEQLPVHDHKPQGSTKVTGGVADPTGAVWGAEAASPLSVKPYAAVSPNQMALMNAQALGDAGGNLAHNNMQPYLELNFIIATDGLYPEKP